MLRKKKGNIIRLQQWMAIVAMYQNLNCRSKKRGLRWTHQALFISFLIIVRNLLWPLVLSFPVFFQKVTRQVTKSVKSNQLPVCSWKCQYRILQVNTTTFHINYPGYDKKHKSGCKSLSEIALEFLCFLRYSSYWIYQKVRILLF